jgi:hypothetical protein
MNFYEFDAFIRNENFFGAAKQGFQQSYGATKPQPQQLQQQSQNPTEQSQDPTEQPPKDQATYQKIVQAMAKANTKVNEFSKMLGIPPQHRGLVITLITSGILAASGVGVAAIPFGVVNYVVKKQANKVAGATFDKGVQFAQKGVQFAQKGMQRNVPQAIPATESYYYEGFGDWAGQKMGQAAGYTAGKTSNVAATVANAVKSSMAAAGQWVWTNKIGITKVMFLIAVGILITQGTAFGAEQVTSGLEQAGVPGVKELRKHLAGVVDNPGPKSDDDFSHPYSINSFAFDDEEYYQLAKIQDMQDIGNPGPQREALMQWFKDHPVTNSAKDRDIRQWVSSFPARLERYSDEIAKVDPVASAQIAKIMKTQVQANLVMQLYDQGIPPKEIVATLAKQSGIDLNTLSQHAPVAPGSAAGTVVKTATKAVKAIPKAVSGSVMSKGNVDDNF